MHPVSLPQESPTPNVEEDEDEQRISRSSHVVRQTREF